MGVCDFEGNSLEPCFPLTNYSDAKWHWIGAVIVKLLPGRHLVTSQHRLSVNGIKAFTMLPYDERGNNATVNIVCTGNGTLSMSFSRVKTLKIHSLSISQCTHDRLIIINQDLPNYFEIFNCSFHNNSEVIYYSDFFEEVFPDGILSALRGDPIRPSPWHSNPFMELHKKMTLHLYDDELATLDHRNINCDYRYKNSRATINISASNFIQNNKPYGTLISLYSRWNERNLFMSDCKFDNNYFMMSGSILESRICEVELNECTFSNNAAKEMLSLKNSRNVVIKQSQFISNKAENGGAFFTSQCNRVTMIGVISFINNTAKKKWRSIIHITN